MNRTILLSGMLLCFPIAFLVSAVNGNPIWPTVLGNPVFLLATALAATALVLRPFTRFEAKDRSIQFSLKHPPLANIAIATLAVCIATVVVGYGFVENFAAR